MSNPFTSIPPAVRRWLYLAYGIVGLALGGVQVYGADHLGSLDVGKALNVLAYVGVALGFTAASNMPSYEDVVDGDAPPEGGESLVTVALVVLIVVAVLVILTRG